MENDEKEFREATIDEIKNLKDEIGTIKEEIDTIKYKSKFLHFIVGTMFVMLIIVVVILSINFSIVTNILK